MVQDDGQSAAPLAPAALAPKSRGEGAHPGPSGPESPLRDPECPRRQSKLAHWRRMPVMRTIDFSPLYRSAVGSDRLAALLESASRSEAPTGYPPYNIETVGENAYRIEIAVAGFKPEELNIEARENVLT